MQVIIQTMAFVQRESTSCDWSLREVASIAAAPPNAPVPPTLQLIRLKAIARFCAGHRTRTSHPSVCMLKFFRGKAYQSLLQSTHDTCHSGGRRLGPGVRFVKHEFHTGLVQRFVHSANHLASHGSGVRVSSCLPFPFLQLARSRSFPKPPPIPHFVPLLHRIARQQGGQELFLSCQPVGIDGVGVNPQRRFYVAVA